MFELKLLPKERDLFNAIEFDATKLNHGTFGSNARLVKELYTLLQQRDAFPKQRKEYLSNPDYFISGRGKSRLQRFILNAPKDDELVTNPSFLKYLWYLICGADLPETLMTDYKSFIQNLGQITSGDIEPLRKEARRLTRAYNLNTYDSASEFYKFALDCGVYVEHAKSIYEAVKSAR